MLALAKTGVSPFLEAIANGLSRNDRSICSEYLYDQVGINLLRTLESVPEFGISEAQQRLGRRHLVELTDLLPGHFTTVALDEGRISSTDSWLAQARAGVADSCSLPLLFTLSGTLIGDPNEQALSGFLRVLRSIMRRGDYFMFTADLVKSPEKMISAYNDEAGVVSAFNKNILCRINRELGGHFDPSQFEHEVRWNGFLRRIELHLRSRINQDVYVSALGRRFHFRADETIRTICFRKFSELELEDLAGLSGFCAVKTWIDIESAFAQVLWRA